jgi:hypothetical protein
MESELEEKAWELFIARAMEPCASDRNARMEQCRIEAGEWLALRPAPAPRPPLPYQAEAIARGELAERLRVAEARVAMLERAARWALGEGDSDFPGPYAGYGAIGWRVKFRALLEGAQP